MNASAVPLDLNACPVGELVAWWRLSAADVYSPGRTARIVLDEHGKISVSGDGNPAILDVLKSRRDEVAVYLTWENASCSACQVNKSTFAAYTGDRYCDGCAPAVADRFDTTRWPPRPSSRHVP
jgi:hypothetical protein